MMKFEFKTKIIIVVALAAACMILFCACRGNVPSGDDIVNTLSPTSAPTPSPVPRDISNDTYLADSIVYANNSANKVQAVYTDSITRSTHYVSNNIAKLNLTLNGSKYVGLTEVQNANGKSVISLPSSGFLELSNGVSYYTRDSYTPGRINSTQIGYYYYRVNLYNLHFGGENVSDAILSEHENIKNDANIYELHDVDNLQIKDGIVSYKVTSPYDPFFTIKTEKYDVTDCNYVVLECSLTNSVSGEIFYHTSKSEYNFVSFSLIPDGNFHTYFIPMTKNDFVGNIDHIRFDVNGSIAGEEIKIKSFKVVKFDDSTFAGCGYAQTFNTFPDKIQNELRIIFDKNSDNLFNKFGYEYLIPISDVDKMIFVDNDGKTFTSVDSLNTENLQYAGFDIKDAGVFGIIVPYGITSYISVTSDGTNYIVRNYVDIQGSHKASSDKVFSHQIYVSVSHSFDELDNAAYIERHPLEVITQKISTRCTFRFKGYDGITGTYKFTTNGTTFQVAYDQKKEVEFGGSVKFIADDRDRICYVYVNGSSGCLEAAAILDKDGLLMPISPEVCKNFGHEKEEPYYDPNDTEYGNTYYPIVVKKNEDSEHIVLNMYQYWGTHNLKQLSSISFHITYYHLSTGTTESNCIVPYYCYGNDGWVLTDFRGCSGIMWKGQPQFNAAGMPTFLSFIQNNGLKTRAYYTGSQINSTGPVYADLDYSYKFDDGGISYNLRHLEFAQTDENRTIYEVSILFERDYIIKNPLETFSIFDYNGRVVYCRSTSYLSDNGVVTISNDDHSDGKPYFNTLAKGSSYYAEYDYDGRVENEGANFGIVIRDYEVIKNGKKWDGNLAVRSTVENNSLINRCCLTLDSKEDMKFSAGDTIKLTMVILPFGVEKQTNYDNILNVYEDFCLKPFKVQEVKVGSLVDESIFARVACENNVAEFTVTGGRNVQAIRVDGFTKLSKPILQELVDGTWIDVVYNVYDYDGYQINYAFDGTYSISFSIDMDVDMQRTFRISMQ